MVTVTATRCNPIGSGRLTTTHATNARTTRGIPNVSRQHTHRLVIELPRRANRDDHQGDGTQPVDPARAAEEHPPHDHRACGHEGADHPGSEATESRHDRFVAESGQPLTGDGRYAGPHSKRDGRVAGVHPLTAISLLRSEHAGPLATTSCRRGPRPSSAATIVPCTSQNGISSSNGGSSSSRHEDVRPGGSGMRGIGSIHAPVSRAAAISRSS